MAALVALALVAESFTFCRQERLVVVDRLTVANPTAYRLDVELSSARSNRALLLGTVPPGTDAAFRDVPDQGELWVFVFLHGGREVDVLALRHKQLEDRGWRIVIPMAVEEHLRSLGTAP